MVQIARRPDAYSGDGHVDEWCLQMDMFIMASDPAATDNAKKIALFTNLTGAALTWAKSQVDPKTNTPIGTPTEFAHRLIARFTPYADARKAEAELEHLVLKTTVSKYIKDFTAIVSRIPNMNDDDQRRRFTEGIKKKSIRRAVDRANPTTFDDACRAALIEDLDFVTAATATTATTSAPRPSPPANSNAMDIDAFQTPRLNKLTDQERAYLRSINACFRCRQTGHQQHTCPLLSGQRKQFNQNKQQFPQRHGTQVNNMEWPVMPYGYPAPYPYMPNPYMYSAFGFSPGPATQQQQQQQKQPPQDFQPGQ